ncbi:zinc finger imprinted 2 [Phyllostomus hastatus]|uniref:zinc finger imprinted 2 n=1 Tax=Phyllostomus hastatus TaxID=9423 RepID=UPI001E6823C5|nr:zinc finger imprinted 2 [Phyllostomus hastatus]
MSHMTRGLDILRKPHLFYMHNPETIPIRNPAVLKISHEKFKHFQALSVTGPHKAVSQIWELCCQWLQPEIHTKEQMMELLVLEQFLYTLPVEVQTWVRSKRPKNSKEAGTLVANLIRACEEEDFPDKNSVLMEERDTKEPKKEDTNVSNTLPSVETQCPFQGSQVEMPTGAAEELVTFQDVFVDFNLEELTSLNAAERKLHREVTLENYQNLVSVGYQFSKPDIISQLEEESCVMQEESATETGQDWERGPETKDLTPKQSQPVEKSSLEAGMEDLEIDNFWHVGHTGESSPADLLDLCQVNKEKPVSSGTVSEPKTLAQETNLDRDDFERNSNLTKQSAGSPGADSQECTDPGTCTSPSPVVNKPFLQEPRINRCEFCKRTFSTQMACKKHERIHTGKKPSEGKQCGETLYLMPYLTRHLGAHSGDKSPGKSFIQRASICGRVRIHSQEDYFECFQCGKAFIQNEHLFQHLQDHESAKALPRGLPRKKTYLIRYRRKHDYVGERAHQCCDCSRAFRRSSQLIQHYRIHAQERPFQCQLCGKCFSRPSQLTQHYQLHSQEKSGVCNCY